MSLTEWIADGGTVMAWIFNTVCKEHGESKMRNLCTECVSRAILQTNDDLIVALKKVKDLSLDMKSMEAWEVAVNALGAAGAQ